MKNVLVDAIRQANRDEPGQTLSDSGSFDTADSDFGVTANDAVADTQSIADELQLYETSNALTASDGGVGESIVLTDTTTSELAEAELPSDVQRTVPAVSARFNTVRRTPVLSRYSPHICVLLAALAAATWLMFQQLQIAQTGGILSAVRPTSAVQEQPGTVGGGQARFRFIESPVADSQEPAE